MFRKQTNSEKTVHQKNIAENYCKKLDCSTAGRQYIYLPT
jgi:hypothetical protein